MNSKIKAVVLVGIAGAILSGCATLSAELAFDEAANHHGGVPDAGEAAAFGYFVDPRTAGTSPEQAVVKDVRPYVVDLEQRFGFARRAGISDLGDGSRCRDKGHQHQRYPTRFL